MLTLVAQFKKNIADGLLYGSNSDGLHLLWEGYRDLPGRWGSEVFFPALITTADLYIPAPLSHC